jgi:hypothetical protein
MPRQSHLSLITLGSSRYLKREACTVLALEMAISIRTVDSVRKFKVASCLLCFCCLFSALLLHHTFLFLLYKTFCCFHFIIFLQPWKYLASRWVYCRFLLSCSPCALTEHHAMKEYWGSGCIGPGILHLGTRWRWVVSFTPLPLYPQGKSPWCPLDRRLGGPQSRSGHGREEKNSQPLPGLEPPIIKPVVQILSFIN